MDPLLVISNSDAGTSDEESLQAALTILRTHTDVEVQATSNPGELNSALHRAGSRRIVVAGGDGSLHAVVTTLYRRNDLKSAVLGHPPARHRQRLRARQRHPPRHRGGSAGARRRRAPRPIDLIVDEVGEIVVNNVHAGAGAQASRKGAEWKERLHSVGVGKANLGKLGYPIGAALAAVETPLHPGRRRGRRRDDRRHGRADPDGRGRQRRQGRRRHRADAVRRPARRPGRRDDLPRDRPVGQVRLRRPADDRQASPSATT